MSLSVKKHPFICLIPVLTVVMGLADGVYADGEVNRPIDAREATTDSDGNLSADPVRISSSGNFVGWIRANTWICFRDFYFGTGPIFLDMEAAAKRDGGVVFLRQGDPYGYEIGQIAIPSTGDWRVFDKFAAPLTPNAQSTGKKDLYLVFDGPSGAFNIRSFTLYDDRVPLPQIKNPEAAATDAGTICSGEMDNKAPPAASRPESPAALPEPPPGEKGILRRIANLSLLNKIIIALPFVSLSLLLPFFLYRAKKAAEKEAAESKTGKTYDF